MTDKLIECKYLGPSGKTRHGGKLLKTGDKVDMPESQAYRFCLYNGFEPKDAPKDWREQAQASPKAAGIKPKVLTVSQLAARRAALVAKVGSEKAADEFLEKLKKAEDTAKKTPKGKTPKPEAKE